MDTKGFDTAPNSLRYELDSYPLLTIGSYTSGYLYRESATDDPATDIDVYRLTLDPGEDINITVYGYDAEAPDADQNMRVEAKFYAAPSGLIRAGVAFWSGDEDKGEVTLSAFSDRVTEGGDFLLMIHPGLFLDRKEAGYDILIYRAGDDLPTKEPDCEEGTPGKDRFKATADPECFDGMGGRDRVTFYGSPEGVKVHLGNGIGLSGYAFDDRYRSIEDATGSGFDDTLIGSGKRNFLEGLDGDDALFGWGGKDRLKGGADKDELYGGAKNDRLIGGTGNDKLFGGPGNDKLLGGGDNDRLFGGSGDDVLKGERGKDRLYASEGNDTLNGGRGFDIADFSGLSGSVFIEGKSGGRWEARESFVETTKLKRIEKIVGTDKNDVIRGTDGGVEIEGGKGRDSILAGNGFNKIHGGARGDELILGAGRRDDAWGESGHDTFAFLSRKALFEDYGISAETGPRKIVVHDFTGSAGSKAWSGDRLVFKGFKDMFADDEALLDSAVQKRKDTVFHLDDLTIRLTDTDLGQLITDSSIHEDIITIL